MLIPVLQQIAQSELALNGECRHAVDNAPLRDSYWANVRLDADDEAALVMLPHASLAVQVTSVLPSGKVLPLGGSQTR
jgi:hypothetical protein